MEDLPSELLLIIVQKLVVQAPSSLLRAACACKRFHAEGGKNPGMWREAFLGTVTEPYGEGWLTSEGKYSCKELGSEKEVEDEIMELTGGFKHLVVARCRAPEQTHNPQVNSLPEFLGLSVISLISVEKYLILLRHSTGRILVWGIDSRLRPVSNSDNV